MKIEKISETQIRCTLNRDDLLDRQLRLSELAYGSEKAKALFQDMMRQANSEFGFEADDIPLMIEAIPVSPECLVLIVTKIEEPEELDTRFSNFTPYNGKESEDESEEHSYADEIINRFERIEEILGKKNKTSDKSQTSIDEDEIDEPETEADFVSVQSALAKVYAFRSMKELRSLATIITPFYTGKNTLYKNRKNNQYYLVIYMSGHSPEEFNKICNIITEYGKPERTNYATVSYYDEHYDLIVTDKAIQHLAKL